MPFSLLLTYFFISNYLSAFMLISVNYREFVNIKVVVF
jgi:hypothetical protein